MKIFLRIILVLNAIFIGFCITAFVGAHFLIDKGDGLAGSATVVGYGALGAFLFTIVAFLTSRKLSIKGLGNFVIASVVVSAITIGLLGIRVNSL